SYVNSSSGDTSTSFFQSGNAAALNAWAVITTITLDAGQTMPTVKFAYASGNASRTYVDAFKFDDAGPVGVPSGDRSWNSGGTDNNWSTAANWAAGIAPNGSGDTVQFGTGARTSPVMDNTYSVNSLTFNS